MGPVKLASHQKIIINFEFSMLVEKLSKTFDIYSIKFGSRPKEY